MITTKKYTFQSKDHVTIHGICMIPDNPAAVLQIVHGMNEHKERYIDFMKSMAEKGYLSWIQDNCGHGESIKNRNDIGYCYPSMEKGMTEDIWRATRHIRQIHPELPVILYGHSLGSLIVRAYLKNYDDAIDGLVIAGCPSYNSAVPFGKIIVQGLSRIHGDHYRSALVNHLVSGSFNLPFLHEHRPYAWLSTDSSVSEAFRKDPLCQFTYTLNGFMTVLRLETAVYKDTDYQVKNPQLPVLFLSGEDDPCLINVKKWKAAMLQLKKMGYQDVRGKMFAGMRHELHNEPGKLAVFQTIDQFCTACCSRKRKNPPV